MCSRHSRRTETGFPTLRTGSAGSALGVATFFIFADKECGFRPGHGRIFHFCGQGVRGLPLAWPHFSFLRTGRVGSALDMTAFFIFADRESGVCPWRGRIFHFCGQGVQVPPWAWPHFSFLWTGSAGSALSMAAFF